jgi:pimeloyl-ACP methyl ester carboxylesterase
MLHSLAANRSAGARSDAIDAICKMSGTTKRRDTPRLLPAVESVGETVLRLRGILSHGIRSPLGWIHFYDARGTGTTAPVVFLHGVGASAVSFGLTMLALRTQCSRVIAIDLPGHGLSDAPAAPCSTHALYQAVAGVLRELLQEPFVLVGNSLGGAMALEFAIEHGPSLAGLVLMSPAGAALSAEEWRELRTLFDVKSRAQGHAFLQRLYHHAPWYCALVAGDIPAAFGTPTIRGIFASASNDALPETAALAKLQVPILFIWGASECILPESMFRYFHAHLPAHTVFERPWGWGHCPHLDAPKEVAERIAQFALASQRKV